MGLQNADLQCRSHLGEHEFDERADCVPALNPGGPGVTSLLACEQQALRQQQRLVESESESCS